jgi:erythronate-4-phosphate dehydrogenase
VSPVIVLDRDTPFLEEIFSGIGHIVAVSEHEIGADVLSAADAVIVRSITRVDKNLLSGSSVRFVGTATAGIDHLDTEFLSRSGIKWAQAPGANAQSVVEYVLAAISVIAARRKTSMLDKTLGVIGYGQVGERLCQVAESLGMRVMRNDPPRAEQEGADGFVDLQECVRSADILSVHVPLTQSGSHPTLQLLDERVLEMSKPGAWLIQAARGGVVKESAAIAARREGVLDALVLDVFENEPTPTDGAIDSADLATGHIAGYSRDAKRVGAMMMRSALVEHFGLRPKDEEQAASPEDPISTLKLPDSVRDPADPAWMDAVLRQVYDIRVDDFRFRQEMRKTHGTRESLQARELARSEAFHGYRASYPARFTWSRYKVEPRNVREANVLSALGFRTDVPV